MMKICTQCFREFEEDNDGPSPADVLGQICVDTMENGEDRCLCPRCREELGVLNLLGFGM